MGDRSSLRSSLHGRLLEVGRFLLVGGAATVVALLFFNILVHGLVLRTAPLADQPVLAYVVANTVGMLVSYHGSRTYVFPDRPAASADGGFTAYVVINAITMALPVACLVLSRDVLGLDDPVSDNVAANVVGLALGLAARFYLFRTYVFRRPIHLSELYDEPAPAGTDASPLSGAPTATSRTRPDAPPAHAAAAG